MNHNAKTLIFVAVAAVCALLAWVVMPSHEPAEAYVDEGELFFESFKPSDIDALEVFSFDDEGIKQFEVENKDGRWVIPSHDDYPADVKDQLAEAANLLIAVKKGEMRSDSAKDHKLYQVVDPKNLKLESIEGRGKRVTVTGKGGKILADLIIGKPLEDRSGHYFVREPDSNRVYTAKVDAADISTRFADWVDTDLIETSSWDMKRIERYMLRPDQDAFLRRVPGATIQLLRDNEDNWTMASLPEGKVVDESKVNEYANALSDLTLVDVQRRDPQLVETLRHIEQGKPFDQRMAQYAAIRLALHGFQFGRPRQPGRLPVFSKEGQLQVADKSGVVYTLLFGEANVGKADVEKTDKDNVDTEAKDSKTIDFEEHRYLMIRADFDPSALGPRPVAPDKPDILKQAEVEGDKKADAPEPGGAEPGDDAGDAGTSSDGSTGEKDAGNGDKAEDKSTPDAKADATASKAGAETADGDKKPAAPKVDPVEEARRKYDAALTEYKREVEAYDKKVEEGREKAEKLDRKYSQWYYVISAETFEKLKRDREFFLKDKPEPKPEKKEDGKDGEGDADAGDAGGSDDADAGSE